MVKFLQVPPREADLMRKWREEGKGISEIVKLTGRAKQTVISHATPQKKPRIGSGRRKIITAHVFKKLLKTMQSMQKKANAMKEISFASIKKKAGVQASDRVILQEFHANDIWFRPLRQKPILEDEDVIARRAFADKYRTRSGEGWVEQPQAIIDNKNFPIYQRDKDRNEAARRQVRGGYRRRGDLPKPFLVKRKPQMKYSAPSVQVTAAIVKGKVRMFVFVKGNWNGEKAAQMYKGPLLTALRKAYPEKAAAKNSKFIVLEDNDPSGYKSSKGVAAKKEVGIISLDLPKRSPDLNPLDYSIWKTINDAMRKQEQKMKKTKRESQTAYMARLRKTALALPTATAQNAVKDMYKRVRVLAEAGGGLIKA